MTAHDRRPRTLRAILVLLAIATVAPRLSGDQAFRDKRTPEERRGRTARLGLGRRSPRALPSPSASTPAPFPSVSVSVSAAPSTSAAPAPSTSGTPSAFDLPVDDYEDPLVIEPPPKPGTRFPVMIGVHGLSSTPESVCDHLKEGVGQRAFVLCPVGAFVGYENGERMFQFLGAEKIWDEADAGLEALQAKYADIVDIKQPIYLGFSQGGIMGVDVVAKEGNIVRAVFFEGGQDGWVHSRIDAWSKRGGVRLLFVTGSDYWEVRAKAAVREFDGTSVLMKHVHLPGNGHHFTPLVGETVEDNLEWLVEGDRRW